MTTRTSALKNLLDRAAADGGANWKVVGSNRLRAKLNAEVDAIILVLPAGYVNYTVSIEVGPRFSKIERVVNTAGRLAGLPDSHFKTASVFPTVFQRLNKISHLPDHAALSDEGEIIDAIRGWAFPFITNISSTASAADYALRNGLAYGHHTMRIPVLLADAGRRDEAFQYLDNAVAAEGVYSELLSRYRTALMDVI